MPNIPAIRNKLAMNSRLNRRGYIAAPVESIENAARQVRRQLERRHNRDRRHRQLAVLLDRRQPGFRRTRADASNTEVSGSLSDTVGKHINTTA